MYETVYNNSAAMGYYHSYHLRRHRRCRPQKVEAFFRRSIILLFSQILKPLQIDKYLIKSCTIRIMYYIVSFHRSQVQPFLRITHSDRELIRQLRDRSSCLIDNNFMGADLREDIWGYCPDWVSGSRCKFCSFMDDFPD